jgi:LCP family protein required for cell wall assembly
MRGKSRGRSRFKKFALTIFIILFLITSGIVVYGYSILNRLNSNETTTEQININEPVNILLLGVDAGDYANKTTNNPSRSDTMIIIRYIPENNKVYMLSIPRDTRVLINGDREKLNSAHRIGGPSLAIETIEKMLGIKINYYAKVDYAGFRNCIDAIGGIDMEIPFNMDYDAYDISIHFKKGEIVHMDGKKAEEFVRWRKNNDGGGYAMGDLGRAATQQKFMLKVVEKMKTPSGILKVPGLIETASKYVTTDMSPKTMLKYMFKLRNINISQIDNKVLQGEPKYIGGVSFFIYDVEKNQEFLSNFKDSSTKIPEVEADKNKIKIKILNSTGIKGLASEYKKNFENLGYNVISIGNYSIKQDSTLINDYSTMNYGQTILNDLGFGDVQEKQSESTESDVVVILGNDSVK